MTENSEKDGLDPVAAAPHRYRVLFENERVRVLGFEAPPGETWALHSHPDMIVVSLTDYVVRNAVPGNEATERQAREGEVLWIPARAHTGENAGSTPMRCVLVELKEPRTPSR